MGLCSAYYLQNAGWEVVVVEKEKGPAGSSLGNAGMIVPSHFTPLAAPGVISQALKWLTRPTSPFSVKPRLDWDLIQWGLKFMKSSRYKIDEKRSKLLELNFKSRILFEEILETEKLSVGFKPRGLSMYCKTNKAFREEVELAEISQKMGQKATIMSFEEAASFDPGLELDVEGAVHYPNDAFLVPSEFIQLLKAVLIERGAEFVTNSEVKRLNTESNRIVGFQINDRNIEADEYVLASGIWSADLAKSVGIRIPMQAGKGYSFTLNSPPHLPEICSILVEARIAVTPMHQNLRFAGTMEIAGLNDQVSEVKVKGIRDSIPEYFPQFKNTDFSNLPVWKGFRPCSPDGLPYLGRTQKFKNLTLCTGHAMMGLSLGPVSGKIVSDVITNNYQPGELISPDRF